MLNFFNIQRRKAGLSQTALAKQLGLRSATVSAWENNLSAPRPGLWARLATNFNTDIETIARAVRNQHAARHRRAAADRISDPVPDSASPDAASTLSPLPAAINSGAGD